MMMKHCAIQHKNVYAPCEDMARDYVVCPKPRRAGLFNSSSVRPAGWLMSHQVEVCDSTTGTELLDIFLLKGGGHDTDRRSYTHLSPFFSGSPPTRASNPLIQDPRFVEVKQPQASLTPSYFQNPTLNLSMSSSQSSSTTRKDGLGRTNFGTNPAVRVEGFEALDRYRRNCSIPTLA